MKSVLISIQPYWVFLIIAKIVGWNIPQRKTVEVRKNYPKAENWNKSVKIHCSKNKRSFSKIPKEYQPLMEQFLGKVIGEFVCDSIDTVDVIDTALMRYLRINGKADMFFSQESCLDVNALYKYLLRSTGYGWHISQLKIYDEPKLLTDFTVRECLWHNIRNNGCIDASGERCYDCRLKRPPQSWCYVEGN